MAYFMLRGMYDGTFIFVKKQFSPKGGGYEER